MLNKLCLLIKKNNKNYVIFFEKIKIFMFIKFRYVLI